MRFHDREQRALPVNCKREGVQRCAAEFFIVEAFAGNRIRRVQGERVHVIRPGQFRIPHFAKRLECNGINECALFQNAEDFIVRGGTDALSRENRDGVFVDCRRDAKHFQHFERGSDIAEEIVCSCVKLFRFA